MSGRKGVAATNWLQRLLIHSIQNEDYLPVALLAWYLVISHYTFNNN